MAKPVPKWKDLGTSDQPLSGPARLVDRALVLLVGLGMLALAATPFLRRAPEPAGIRFLCLAGTNDAAAIPPLPYLDALTVELEALFPSDRAASAELPPDGEAEPEPKSVERVGGGTRDELLSNLRKHLAMGNSRDTLVVYCQMHLVQAGGEAGLVCGDFRFVEAGTRKAVPGLLPVSEVVRAMDEVDAPCRLLLLDTGDLSLEPQLGVFLNDFSTGLGGRSASPSNLVASAAEDGDEESSAESPSDSDEETIGSPTFVVVSRMPHQPESVDAARRMTRFSAGVTEALRFPGQADLDEDGNLTVAELLAAVRREMARGGTLFFRDRQLLADDDESAWQTVLLENAAWPAPPTDSLTDDPDERALAPAAVPALPASSFDPLLKSLEAARKRSDALLAIPAAPASWRLFHSPQELLVIERDLARVEFQMLFQRNTDDDLLDLEIALRRVVREIENLEQATEGDVSNTQWMQKNFGSPDTPDLWGHWCALQHARFRLVDVVRLHDRIGHRADGDWLLPAAKKLFAAITADTEVGSKIGSLAAITADPEEPLKIGSSAATILTEEIEREVAGLVGGLLKRLGDDAAPVADDIGLARDLLPGGLVSSADRARLLRAIVERTARIAVPAQESDAPPETSAGSGSEPRSVGIPDETLSKLAAVRFELHALLIRELLDPQARDTRDLFIEEWAVKLARTNQTWSRSEQSTPAYDAVFREAVYSILQPSPAPAPLTDK